MRQPFALTGRVLCAMMLMKRGALMVISASRRTDIPAFYMDWFCRRLREGFALVRNPMNAAQVRQVALTPDEVDCIVFWSKNPAPMLGCMGALAEYPYYVQYTLNAYGPDMEPNLPPAMGRIDTFRRISDMTGPARVLWRYDPILLAPGYSPAFHEESFARLARELSGYTERVTISFFDRYAKTAKATDALGIRRPFDEEAYVLAGVLAEIARANGLSIATCAEAGDYTPLGIGRASCVDASLIKRITGRSLALKRDKNQRPACGCTPSVDIGAYHTCTHGCAYCYANTSLARATANHVAHDPHAPLLLR